MPTYEYSCTTCGQSFEAVQSMRDPHFEICPEALCRVAPWGHGCVKRQLGTGAGLIFKGSGFYITDYRSENYKAGAKNEAPAADAAPAAASSGSGESKPAEGNRKTSDAAPPTAPKPATEPAKPGTTPPKSPAS